MDAERIMERVRRLLAIANDPAASDNEQRIALEQAQRLMDRHAIEEWQLEEDHDAIEIQPVGLPARKTGRGTPGHRTQGDRQGRRLGSGKVGRHLQNITHV